MKKNILTFVIMLFMCNTWSAEVSFAQDANGEKFKYLIVLTGDSNTENSVELNALNNIKFDGRNMLLVDSEGNVIKTVTLTELNRLSFSPTNADGIEVVEAANSDNPASNVKGTFTIDGKKVDVMSKGIYIIKQGSKTKKFLKK